MTSVYVILYKRDCYSMCDFKSTQWSAVSLKASTSNEQLPRLIRRIQVMQA